jgi:DNA-binding transcriptional ArsR family regulator
MHRLSRDRRRAEAHRLADPEGEALGVREIARRLGVNPSTVSRDLREPAPEIMPVANIQDAEGRPVAGAAKGNRRAEKHGAFGEQRVAPLREHHAAELRRDYPRLDDRRLTLLADRLARIEAASAWLDRQAGLVRNVEGEVFPVVKAVESWSARAEAVLAEVEVEHRKARRFADLEGYLESEEEGEGRGEGE